MTEAQLLGLIYIISSVLLPILPLLILVAFIRLLFGGFHRKDKKC